MGKELQGINQGKLDRLLAFLQQHREHNHAFQEKYYQSLLLPYQPHRKKERVLALLYSVANTQSQPKLDPLCKFFKNLESYADAFDSLHLFVKALNSGEALNIEKSPFLALFKSLETSSGWGPKTAALFVKTIYHIHHSNYANGFLKIWHDVPQNLPTGDEFKLPVDAVIIEIFSRLGMRKAVTFNGINKVLSPTDDSQSKGFSKADIEVWDDLWFWGFITQKSAKDGRVLEWNEAKYWSLEQICKDADYIDRVKKLAEEFIGILEN